MATILDHFKYPPQLQPAAFVERFNKDVARILRLNPEVTRALERKTRDVEPREVSDGMVCVSVFASGDEDERAVTYGFSRKSTKGRLYAKAPVALQRTPKHVRHALTRGVLLDWDIAKCYPTILLCLAKTYGIATPMLEQYVTDGGRSITELSVRLGISVDDTKTLVLSVINGKDEFDPTVVERDTVFLKSFAGEVKAVGVRLMKAYPEIKTAVGNVANARGKVVSRVLEMYESRALDIMVKTATGLGVVVRALMFDGMMTDVDVPPDFGAVLTSAIHRDMGEHFHLLRVVEKPIPEIDLEAVAREAGVTLIRPGALEPAEQVAFEYLPKDVIIKSTARILLLVAAMATGKTEALMSAVKAFRRAGKSVLVLTQRRAMAFSYADRCKRDGLGDLVRYDVQECRGGAGKGLISAAKYPHAICEYESIRRVEGRYDLVVLDEVRSVVATMNSPTNEDKGINLGVVKGLLLNAEKVVSMDADALVDGAVRDLMTEISIERMKIAAADALTDMGKASTPDAKLEVATRAADLMKRAKDGDVEGEFEIVNWPHRRMTRHVHVGGKAFVMCRLLELVREGKRVGVCCFSKSQMLDLKTVLEANAPGHVTVYYGGCDNLVDLSSISHAWDKYQVILFNSCITTGADYDGRVHSVFAFPALNNARPRDLHQMVGRFRNVESGDVWIEASEKWWGNMEEVTQEALLRRFEQHMACVRYGAEAAKKLCDHAVNRLISMNSILPADVPNGTVQGPDSLLAKIMAYDRCEADYCRTGGTWLSYFRYMAELKGYEWTLHADAEVDPDAEDDIAFQLMTAKEERKQEREDAIAGVDVHGIAENSTLRNALGTIASGRMVSNQEMALEELAQYGVTKNRAADAMMKVRLVASEGVDEACVDSGLIDAMRRDGKAIMLQRLLAVPEGSMDITALFMHAVHSYRSQTVGFAPPPLLHRYFLLDRLARVMGLSDLRDRDTPVRYHKYSSREVLRIVKEMASIGMCGVAMYDPRGGVLLGTISSIFERHMGTEKLKVGSPLCCSRRLQAFVARFPPLDITEWYARECGGEARHFGEFAPHERREDTWLTEVLRTEDGVDEESRAQWRPFFDRVRATLKRKREAEQQPAHPDAMEVTVNA